MEYKELTDDQLKDAAELFQTSFNSPPWNDQWTKETAFQRLSAMLHAENAFGLALYEENQLRGMMLGHIEEYYDGREFLLKEFAIDNAQRGKGYGTLLMAEAKKRLKEQNVKRIVLVTLSDDRTVGFYRHQGFETDTDAVVMKTTL